MNEREVSPEARAAWYQRLQADTAMIDATIAGGSDDPVLRLCRLAYLHGCMDERYGPCPLTNRIGDAVNVARRSVRGAAGETPRKNAAIDGVQTFEIGPDGAGPNDEPPARKNEDLGA